MYAGTELVFGLTWFMGVVYLRFMLGQQVKSDNRVQAGVSPNQDWE